MSAEIVYGIDFRQKLRAQRGDDLGSFTARLIQPDRWAQLHDTAPSEMPPVWPSFEAPERDPA